MTAESWLPESANSIERRVQRRVMQRIGTLVIVLSFTTPSRKNRSLPQRRLTSKGRINEKDIFYPGGTNVYCAFVSAGVGEDLRQIEAQA